MSKAKKPPRRLGRGLSALLGDDKPQLDAIVGQPNTQASASGGEASSGSGLSILPTAFIERYDGQPRVHFDQAALDDLARSVKEKGVLQPILVRRLSQDRYQIIAGERRWRAAQQAGLHEVPVIVLDIDDREALEVAIVENVQRRDLSPIEEARGYSRLIQDFDHTQEVLAKIVGKSRSHVANILRLLGLPDAVQAMVDTGALSMGHARALIGLPEAERLAKEIVDKGLSVRQAEILASANKGTAKLKGKVKAQAQQKDADTKALEKDLSAALGLKVTINHRGDTGGNITVDYSTLEQLDDVCIKLGLGDR